MFTADRLLSLGALGLALLDKLAHSSRRGAALDLIDLYRRGGFPPRPLEGFMSYADLLLAVVLIALVGWSTRRPLPEQGAYLITGLCGAVWLVGYQVLKWFWAGRLCGVRPACHSPAELWGNMPLLLLAGLALLGYFGWRLVRSGLLRE